MSSEKMSFNPSDLAQIIKDKKEAETPDVAVPHEGDIVERDGEKLQFVKVPTGEKVWDSNTQSFVPGYHSLKTWFSHHTERVGPGPGWGTNLSMLPTLSPEEMQQRYGHVFTRDEMFSPGGKWEVDESGGEKLIGGMPDDVPYYDLQPLGTYDSDAQQQI